MLDASSQYLFARYHYDTVNEITMGYEYENTHPKRLFISNLGWDEANIKEAEIKKDCLSKLPVHFQVQYESFGAASGCEIKSVVAPLFLHKQFWNRYVSKLTLDESPNSQTNDSGIHVSVSRTPVTEAGKAAVFGFLHALENRKLFFKISKRTGTSFNLNAPSNPNGQSQEYIDAAGRYALHTTTPPNWKHHYNIINDENTERFEFRLFAAHPTLLLPALEMMDALFKMAVTDDVITIPTFRAYISKFKKYEHIKDHCIATLDHSPS
jgi:hypothetical protein